MKFALLTVFAALLAVMPTRSDAQPVQLHDALEKARERALDMLRLEAELEAARAQVGHADAPNDLILFGNGVWREDRTESSSIFAGEKRNSLGAEAGIRKVFPRATMLEAKFTQTREYTEFPPAPPGQPDGEAFQSFNPSYRAIGEISLSQPLLRNWLGREFELQRDLLQSNVLPAELNLRLQEQMVQAEVEQYYWNLAELEAQQRMTQQLIDLTREFAEQMRRRTQLGRADQVDVADADAALVAQEGRYLDLVFAAQHYQRRLRMAMDPAAGLPADVSGPTGIELPGEILAQGGPAHKVRTAEEAYEYALANRIDLKHLQARRKPLQVQLALAKEQSRPSLNIFGGVGKAGLEGRWDNTIVDTFDDGRHVLYKVGLEAEVNLQKSALDADEKTIAARLVILDVQAQKIQANIRQEIEFAFAGFESARRKRLQAERSINSLESKRQAELRKFRQARSEEIVVLSYQLEVLAGQADLIAAHKLARDSDVRLRTALHAYPSSRSEQ